MSPSYSKGRNQRYYYYRCTDQRNCRNPQISAPDAEHAIIVAVKNMPLHEDDIKACLAESAAEKRRAVEDIKPELNQATRALRQAERDRDKIETDFLSGIVTLDNKDRWNNKLSAATREIDRLTDRVGDLRTIVDSDLSIFDDAENVISQMKWFADAVETAGDNADLKKAFLVAHVARIDRTAAGFNIRLQLNGATNSIEWRPQRESNPCCRDENPVS